MSTAPRLHVVGLGPAGADLVTLGTRAVLETAGTVVLRTARHPAAEELVGPGGPLTGARTCDDLYEAADRLEEVYPAIVERLLGLVAGEAGGPVVYAVPGSPAVAERTVELLRTAAGPAGVDLVVHPALSFADLAWARLGVDPLAAGVRIVDGQRFAEEAAGERGPLLVAQCDTAAVLSDVKLAVEDGPDEPVAWDDLDRVVRPDHLTSLYLPVVPAPVGVALSRLAGLTRTLRAECPWDRAQTHQSLVRHLVEESYEVVEALEALGPDRAAEARTGPVDSAAGPADAEVDPVDPAAYDHLAEELGDLLFQVVLHAELAREAGAFDLAEVATGVHDKLVTRHPHVFGDPGAVAAADTVAGVEANWERIKREEKGRASAMDGIPGALPALLLALKSHERAARAGLPFPPADAALAVVADELAELGAALAAAGPGGTGDDAAVAAELGDVLLAAVGAAHALGVEPEGALRVAAARFADRVRATEAASAAEGVPIAQADPATLDRWWEAAKRSRTGTGHRPPGVPGPPHPQQ